MAILYILGNGFDNHHKLKTCYAEYRKFLINEGECSEILAKYPDGDVFWNDIEAGLKIDYETYINDYIAAYNFIAPLPGEKANQNVLAVNKIEKMTLVLEELLSFTGINFYNWLSQSYEEQRENVNCSSLFKFDKDDYFLTFNYTSTVEDLYKVDSKHILHIHGQLNNVNSSDLYVPITIRDERIIEERHGYIREEMQFGNPYNNPQKMKEKIKSMSILSQNPMFSVDTLLSHLEFYLRSSQKNVEANIIRLESFVNNLPFIDTVVIAGCSLGEADKEYYEQVLIPKYIDKKWQIYCYSDNDRLRAINFADKYGLDCLIKKW